MKKEEYKRVNAEDKKQIIERTIQFVRQKDE